MLPYVSRVFRYGFPVSFLKWISHVLPWVPVNSCYLPLALAVCSSAFPVIFAPFPSRAFRQGVPLCGAPEFHHEFSVGSPITFLYIPHMSACISLICFRYPRMHSAKHFFVIYPLFVIISQTTNQGQHENSILHKEDRKTKA